MIHFESHRTRSILVVLFAIAMAWVESASVFYLRTLVDRVEPYQAHPLPMQDGFTAVELVRDLRMMSGWPKSLLDWDVLFLLPVPWWGPVLAPVSIALLMIVWGTLAGRGEDRRPGRRLSWTVPGSSAAGIVLALYLLMADSFHALRQGLDVARQLPVSFNWPMFGVALLLMSAGVAQFAWQTRWR